MKLIEVATVSLLLLQLCGAEQCGRQAGDALCPNNLCCSQSGWCGSTSENCGLGCQNGPCLLESGLNGSSTLLSATPTIKASFYTEFLPSSCFGSDPGQFPPNKFFGAGGDGEPNIWNNGYNCGKWFKIKCIGDGCISSDTISIEIIDGFPCGCVGGLALQLSDTAFKAIANPALTTITVEYSGPYENP